MEDLMRGRVVLVTGATDGIGRETALRLAQSGATVLVHGRSEQKCVVTADEIIRTTGNSAVRSYAADLASMGAVRSLAAAVLDREPVLHVLLHNAGVWMDRRVVTQDGYETTFAVNHLAPVLLTGLLLGLLKRSAPSRVITVSSIAHGRGVIEFDNLNAERTFGGYDAYARSKLANILFTYELAERLRGTGVDVTCLHPGVIRTKLLRAGFPSTRGDSVKSGAATSVYLAASDEVAGVTGKYFADRREQKSSAASYDRTLRTELWRVSREMVGLTADQ